jgi:hypothetical protein
MSPAQQSELEKIVNPLDIPVACDNTSTSKGGKVIVNGGSVETPEKVESENVITKEGLNNSEFIRLGSWPENYTRSECDLHGPGVGEVLDRSSRATRTPEEVENGEKKMSEMIVDIR